METGKILSADVLDIIFDQRNKEYGAYDLRKNYQQRLNKSLAITLLVVVLICVTYILLGSMKKGTGPMLDTPDFNLAAVSIPKEDKIVVLPPLKKLEPPQVKTIKDMTIRIVKDNVPIDDPVPEQNDLVNAKIGNANAAGPDDIGIAGPPVDEGKGLGAPEKKQDDYGGVFEIVEIESTYPGGMQAWGRFLYNNLVYPQQAIDDGKQGTVYVRFIVDTGGNVSDVQAMSGPEELYAAAVSVIKKSGKWTPAIQNGRKVKSYKKQPITFKLDNNQ